ncbi:MAG: FliH/SctL family protein [Acidimicrobiales bacterium]
MSADHSVFTVRRSSDAVDVASLPVADLFAPAPDAMIEPTGAWAEHLEAVRLASAEDGYDSGYREGFEAGALAAEAANQTLRDQVNASASAMADAIAQLAETDRRVAADLSDDALHLAFDLTQLILDREIHTADDPGLDAIRRCFDFIPRRTSVVVRLNPADAEMLGDVGAVLIGADYEVVADPTIGRGGAIVDAGAARIDGQIDAALGRVADVLGITSRGTSGRTAGGR